MNEVPLEGEGLNKQEGSVLIERGGGPSAMATHLEDVPGRSKASEL